MFTELAPLLKKGDTLVITVSRKSDAALSVTVTPRLFTLDGEHGEDRNTLTHKLEPGLVGRKLRVHVVGAGGNGSQMLSGLARMAVALDGVGHPGLEVTAYDPDIVTEANVGRQLFSPSDVGQFKAEVLVNRINCYFGLRWDANPRHYYDSDSDFMIGCVDSIMSRRELNKRQARYWLDLGNRDRTGQVILGKPKQRWDKATDPTRPLTFFELYPDLKRGKPKEDTAPSCSLAAALELQDLFINQSVATFALQLLWSFIRNGETAIQGYYLNLETGRTVPITVPQPPQSHVRRALLDAEAAMQLAA